MTGLWWVLWLAGVGVMLRGVWVQSYFPIFIGAVVAVVASRVLGELEEGPGDDEDPVD